MQKINIHEAKTKLSAVLMDIEKKGESYLICRNGKPIADLIPHKRQNRITCHPVLSKISVNYDPTEDLSSDEWGEVE
ncbi:MAG: type II toxin-antitoxin system Phd/YefM family antitoxin [Pseudomonadota bacterium]